MKPPRHARAAGLLPALLLLLHPGSAPAAEAISGSAEPARHAVYLDLLGKGGLWGLGYDYRLNPLFAVGGTLSFSLADAQAVFSASPYFAAYPIANARHGWFVHAGPQLIHSRIGSPVPEWQGSTSTRLGAQLSTGYELRARALFRAYGMLAVGAGGAAPWMGFSVGWSF